MTALIPLAPCTSGFRLKYHINAKLFSSTIFSFFRLDRFLLFCFNAPLAPYKRLRRSMHVQ